MRTRLLESIISLEGGRAHACRPQSQREKDPERFLRGAARKRAWLDVARRNIVLKEIQLLEKVSDESTKIIEAKVLKIKTTVRFDLEGPAKP